MSFTNSFDDIRYVINDEDGEVIINFYKMDGRIDGFGHPADRYIGLALCHRIPTTQAVKEIFREHFPEELL